MTANFNPIYTLVPDVSSNASTTMPETLLTATGDYTGVSANHKLLFTAGAEGGFIYGLRCVAIGTNTASVIRVYRNNGSANTTATNNNLIAQYSLPATTATNVAATPEIYIPLNEALNPSFRLYAGLGTTVAAGWVVTADRGGKY